MSSRSAGATYGVPGWVGTPKTVSQKIRKEVSKQTHAVGRKKKTEANKALFLANTQHKALLF